MRSRTRRQSASRVWPRSTPQAARRGTARPSRRRRPAARPCTGLTRQRFEAELPLETEGAALLFHRCYLCGADSQRNSPQCEHCGASLTTPEQEAFDRELFEREQVEQAREAEAARQAASQPSPLTESAQQALGKAFAEEFAQEREAQLPPGLRWLRGLSWPGRLAAVGSLLVLMAFSWAMARGRPGWLLALWGEGALALALFTPLGWWGRRLRRPFMPYDWW